MNSVTWQRGVVHFSLRGRDSLTFRVFGLFEIGTIGSTRIADKVAIEGMLGFDCVWLPHDAAIPYRKCSLFRHVAFRELGSKTR